MKKIIYVLLLTFLFTSSIYAGNKHEKKHTGKKADTSAVKVFNDSGPTTIDISKYPEQLKKYYKLFTKKCSKCHSISRPINTYKTAPQWKRYVKRMMRKPGSEIGPKTAKKIYKFLAYDSKIRIPDDIKKKQKTKKDIKIKPKNLKQNK